MIKGNKLAALIAVAATTLITLNSCGENSGKASEKGTLKAKKNGINFKRQHSKH